MRLSSAVLPEPVLPMMARVWPASTRNEMSVRTGCSAPGNENAAWRSSSDVGPCSSVTPADGATTDDDVWSTSWMRSAHTAARGAMTATNVAIITAIRIWIR